MAVAHRSKPTCRIVVVGDPGVGKSSLISSLISESFSEDDIPSVMKTVRVPLEDMYLHIVDTSSDPVGQVATQAQISRADVIVLVTAPHPEHLFPRVRTHWLPLFEKLQVRCPIVLAINKSREFSDTSPDMEYFQDLVNDLRVEVCKQCSAKNLNFVNDVFYHAQRAVMSPIRPLYDPVTRSITPLYAKALERIFRLIDINHDSLLDNNEFNIFQVLCFGRRLLAGRIDDLKRLLEQKDHPDHPEQATVVGGGSGAPSTPAPAPGDDGGAGDETGTNSTPTISSGVATSPAGGPGEVSGQRVVDPASPSSSSSSSSSSPLADSSALGNGVTSVQETTSTSRPSGARRTGTAVATAARGGRTGNHRGGTAATPQHTTAYLVLDPVTGQSQVTLAGFMAFNLLFIQGVPGVMARRTDLAWTILRRFGYDTDLYLRPDYVPLSTTGAPLYFDQSAELTQEGIAFLIYLFHKYDLDQDGGLSHLRTSKDHPSELECVWASCPDVPFVGDFTANYCTTPGRPGFLNLRGWLAYWSLLTLYEPLIALRSLTYLGYPTLVLDGAPQDPLTSLPNNTSTPHSSSSSSSSGTGSDGNNSPLDPSPRQDGEEDEEEERRRESGSSSPPSLLSQQEQQTTVSTCYNDPTLVHAAIRINPRKASERGAKTISRSAVSVLVFGAAGSGKTTLLQALIGKPFSGVYEPTRKPLSQANWVPPVPGKDGGSQPFRRIQRTASSAGEPAEGGNRGLSSSSSGTERIDLEELELKNDLFDDGDRRGGDGLHLEMDNGVSLVDPGSLGSDDDGEDELLAAIPHQFPLDIEGSGRRFLIMTEIPADQQIPLLEKQAEDAERADLILLTYDGTDRQSFEECMKLLDLVPSSVPCIVLRTKSDLPGCRPLQEDVNACSLDVTFHSVSIKTQPDELLFSRLFQAALNPGAYLAHRARGKYRLSVPTLTTAGLTLLGTAATLAGLWAFRGKPTLSYMRR